MSLGLFTTYSSTKKAILSPVNASIVLTDATEKKLFDSAKSHYQNIEKAKVKLVNANRLAVELNNQLIKHDEAEAAIDNVLSESANSDYSESKNLKKTLDQSIRQLRQSIDEAMQAMDELLSLLVERKYQLALEMLYQECPQLKSYLADYKEDLH